MIGRWLFRAWCTAVLAFLLVPIAAIVPLSFSAGSFLSYPRHEYFRRTLCNLLGGDIARGEIPNDMGLVGGMVKNICFANARDYFGLELAPEFTAKK